MHPKPPSAGLDVPNKEMVASMRSEVLRVERGPLRTKTVDAERAGSAEDLCKVISEFLV